MDQFQTLINAARAKRDQSVQDARRRFNDEMRAIKALQRKMESRGPGRQKYRRLAFKANDPFAGMTMTSAAAKVLSETGPLTRMGLVVALQQRGYRADDPPRLIYKSLESTLARHPERFRVGKDGVWWLRAD